MYLFDCGRIQLKEEEEKETEEEEEKKKKLRPNCLIQ